MTDTISPETFNHLVELAALQLSSAESDYLRQQLNNQLKAIHKLEAIPLDESVAATSHGVPYTAETSPAPRADTWIPYSEPEQILEQAPEVNDGYIIVPDIPHTNLE